MKAPYRSLVLCAAALIISAWPGLAADKISLQVNRRTVVAYRMADLEQAKKAAKDSNKPIAWIASATKTLVDNSPISGQSGRDATAHAFAAFADRAVIVFQDAFAENHQGPQIVDHALHTPDPHYTPPSVVLLDSDVTKILAVITFNPSFESRKEAFKKAILDLPKQ